MRNQLLGGLIVALAAFAAGWYPEFSKRTKAEEERAALSRKLEERNLSLAVARFRNRAALLWSQAEGHDYGATGEAASKLFTDLQAFTNSLPPGPLAQSLERLLGNRDAITAGLAKADPAVKILIREFFEGFPEA